LTHFGLTAQAIADAASRTLQGSSRLKGQS